MATTMTTTTIIRRLFAAGYTVDQIRGRAGMLACREGIVSQTEADACAATIPEWPLCWCGCGRPASAWESDGAEPAHEHCTEYACDDEGQPVCGCDPRVEDHGEPTGGGMHGVSTGWVSRLVVRES